MQKPTDNPNKIRVDFGDPHASRSSHSLLSCRSSFSSMTRSLCRICQSETGTMIRPCACAGTMGKIHERCLNEWVLHSKKECCEICKSDYAKSGNMLLPFREWKKPQLSSSNWIQLIAMCGLMYSYMYLISLFEERQFFRRIFVHGLAPREPDICRIIMLNMVMLFLFGTTLNVVKKVKFYFRKQCKIRFINNEAAFVDDCRQIPSNGDDASKTVAQPRPSAADPPRNIVNVYNDSAVVVVGEN